MPTIRISTLWRKYIKVLPEWLVDEMTDAELRGRGQIDITEETLEKLVFDLRGRNKFDQMLHKSAELNNKGTEYEKQGKIALAIKTYEKNIEGLCYPALHSFTRLLVIYRREKRHDDEMRVLNRALDVFSIGDTIYDTYLEKWKDRLLKLESLKNIPK